MEDEGHEVQLADVAEITSGKRPAAVVKVACPAFPVPVIGGGGPSGFTSEALFSDGALITGRVGTLGKLFAVEGPCWPSDNSLVIRPRSVGATDPTFLRYAVTAVISGAANMNRGAANPLITQGDLGRLLIHHPSIADQRVIGGILRSLDDKIELNRRMNQALEEIARALFNSWFVDFEPVRDKAEGRQPSGMDPGTAALFPASFETLQNGRIPSGWRFAPLDEVAEFRNGLAMQRFPPHGNESLPVVKIAELNRGNTTGADRASAGLDPAYVVDSGDVLFSWSGSLMAKIWCGGRGALNQHLFKVTSKSLPRWFYYFWLLEHLPDFQLIAAGKATTMGHIQRHHLHEALVAVPPQPLLDFGSRVIEPLLSRIVLGNAESGTLQTLRDALLPKLLSGALRATGGPGELQDA